MQQLELPSPAKINLFLHVVGRRPDGYHLLQTVFQFLDFHDDMTFQHRSDSKIILHSSMPLAPEHNLIVKAARLLQHSTQCDQGADITLVKRIPIGGGLGGGSSNAATTLIGLNQLWGLNKSYTELAALAPALGADVAFFMFGKAAFAEGIGERLQAINLDEDWVLLLMPACAVATEKIFSDSQLTRYTPKITITEFLERGGHNDCEPVARKHFPEIAHTLDCLNKYTRARMTGTGSGIFATFKHKEAALEVARKIPASIKVIVTKGLTQSPLHNAIEKINGVSPSGKAQGFDPCIPRFES